MKRIDLNKNGKIIALYGTDAVIKRSLPFIENLELSGIESKDRLIIQKCIDDNKIKADILYDGNTVYSFETIVKKYRQLQLDGTLSKLTKDMYHFFMNACGDIAHYDISGYRIHYGDCFKRLEYEFLAFCRNTSRFTDRDKIFKELKIGEYFKDRESIDINKISLNKLKSIIEECNWEVLKKDNSWVLQLDLHEDNNFSFDVDISNNNTANIVNQIQKYYKDFDQDNYIENILENREKDSKSPTIREIVKNTNVIAIMLSRLSSDIIYKSRIAAENVMDSVKNQNKNNGIDLEFELER